MGDQSSQQKVPNPAVTDLKNLRKDLATDVETYRDALESTASDMGGKKVWTGKAASDWEKQVTHQRSLVKTQVDKLLPIVDAEIAKLPAEVSPAEAKQYYMDQRMYT